jgi:hypothetical protein
MDNKKVLERTKEMKKVIASEGPKLPEEDFLEVIRTGKEMQDVAGFVETKFERLFSNVNTTEIDEEIYKLQTMEFDLENLDSTTKAAVQDGVKFFKDINLKTKLQNTNWKTDATAQAAIAAFEHMDTAKILEKTKEKKRVVKDDLPKLPEEDFLEVIRTGKQMEDVAGFIEHKFERLFSNPDTTKIDEEIYNL